MKKNINILFFLIVYLPLYSQKPIPVKDPLDSIKNPKEEIIKNNQQNNQQSANITKRETIYSVNDSLQQFGIPLPPNTIVYEKSRNITWLITQSATANQNLLQVNKIPFMLQFNGNRTVKRQGIPNVNVGGKTIIEFIENYFFPFVPATLSINTSINICEVGTNNNITITGTTTPNDETIFSDGELKRDNVVIHTFGSNLSFSTINNFYPTTAQSIVYQSFQKVGNNGNPTTIQSNTRTVHAVYAFLYGVSSLDLETGGMSTYVNLNKRIELKSNKSYTLNGNDGYIYFCYPSYYGNLVSILDHNGFENITAFTKYVAFVTSVGLPTNYTVEYYIYKSNNKTSPNNWTYQFKFN